MQTSGQGLLAYNNAMGSAAAETSQHLCSAFKRLDTDPCNMINLQKIHVDSYIILILKRGLITQPMKKEQES